MTQAEAAARDFGAFMRAVLAGTVSGLWPGVKIEHETTDTHIVVTSVTFADGSSWTRK